MSLPGPSPLSSATGQVSHSNSALGLDEIRLRAALITAGFDEDKAAMAVAVLRTELNQKPGVSAIAHPGAAHPQGTGRFRTLADITPQLVWHSASEGRWIWASPNWLVYTGQSQQESQGQGWLAAIHPEDREATMRAWHKAHESGSLAVEHRIRRALDGAWRMHQTRSAPLRSRSDGGRGNGLSPEWIGASTDIEDFRRLENEQHALLLELRHRTRNLLAVVQVIAHRSLSPTLGRSDFAARLAALGRVQGFLSRNAAWSVPLRDLVEAELRASAGREAERVEVTGPQVDLPGEVVQPIALALHELASNAAKHGAMAQPSGYLTVTWRLESSDAVMRLVIEWRESGVAMPPGPLSRRFGCQVIERTVPHQLRGEARLEPGADGIRCRLALPLPEKSGPEGKGWAGSGHINRFTWCR